MSQYDLNLRDYIRIFHKRKLLILATFLVFTILSLIVFLTQPAQYEAVSTIKIEERKTIAGLLTEWIVYNPGDVMESETKSVTGYPVMERVASQMGYSARGLSLEEAVGELQGNIEAERISQTNMIKISARGATREEAVKLANLVAKEYEEHNLHEKAQQATQAEKFIREQLEVIEGRLEEAEKKLKNFNETENVKNIQLAEPIQRKLVELEFQLAEFLQKFTEKHPKVVQLKDQISDMENQVKGFSGKELEYAKLNREVEVNRKLYAMLKEKLEEARITVSQKISAVSLVNRAISASPVAGDKSMKIFLGAFLGLILGTALAFVFETLDTSIGTIEDVERVVNLPVMAVIPAFDGESQPKGLVSSILHQFLPRKNGKSDQDVRLIAHFKPRSPITEAYRNLHTNLKINAEKKVLMVTSANPQEGKSSVVCNLSIVMGQVGLKNVIVSADMRRPVLSRTFGVRKEPGLHEFITGTARLDETINNVTDMILGELSFEDIRKTPGIENISLIPCGRLPENPVELLESKRMEELLESLKKQFDVVILDCPPVLPVTDASILAPKVDSVIIVYEAGKTSREALLRTKVQLESVGAKIAGIVLNHTRPQSESIALYPYYRSKYRYYGKEEQEVHPGT